MGTHRATLALAFAAAFALVAAAPAPARAAPSGLKLTLKMPQTSGNAPCGGLCGLRWGARVRASFTLVNKTKRARVLAYRLSCSGLEGTLVFMPPRGRTKALPRPHRLALQNNRSCRANAPRYVTLAAGGKLTEHFSFKVPALRAAKYDVVLDLEIHPRRGKSFKIASRSLPRLVHK